MTSPWTAGNGRGLRACAILPAALAGMGCSSEGDSHALPQPASDAAVDQRADVWIDGGTSDGSGCTPKSCLEFGAQCGLVPDGCGGTVDCGKCPSGQNCGGAGPYHCGLSECIPKTCMQLNASCGLVPDQCGDTLSCGECLYPETCGGGALPNQCSCTPGTCVSLGAQCGVVLDGCGGLLECGNCPPGKICGGEKANQCGDAPCEPLTCKEVGADCGMHPDGCDGVLNCGTCSAPQTCGGGGDPKACGCTPTTCGAQGAKCGSLSDGCGGTLSCGACTYGSCQSNQCVCTPTTCVGQGAQCGTISDGCGGSLACGTCTPPKQCGVAGVPNVCSCTPALCPPFYQNSFEAGTDFPTGWLVWHNCAADATWYVEVASYPAPSGGAKNLRFHTTNFLGPPCAFPGAYAASPKWPAVPGKTYRVETWSRNAGHTAGTSILFYDSQGTEIKQVAADWAPDAWQYHANPPVSGVAPAGAVQLQVRLSLRSGSAHADLDLLAVYEEP